MKFTAFYNILLSLQLVPGIHEPKAQGQSSNPPETFQQIRQILTHIIGLNAGMSDDVKVLNLRTI